MTEKVRWGAFINYHWACPLRAQSCSSKFSIPFDLRVLLKPLIDSPAVLLSKEIRKRCLLQALCNSNYADFSFTTSLFQRRNSPTASFLHIPIFLPVLPLPIFFNSCLNLSLLSPLQTTLEPQRIQMRNSLALSLKSFSKIRMQTHYPFRSDYTSISPTLRRRLPWSALHSICPLKLAVRF